MRLAAAWMATGCAEGGRTVWDQHSPGADTLRSAAEQATAAQTATLEPGALRTVPSVTVRLPQGPDRPFEVALRTSGLGHARRFGSTTLQTALRPRVLDQYPCTTCHLGRKIVMSGKRIADAHQNVQPVHPEETGALCSTCHAADDVERLALESGERATLDESYRLCAQCHFEQVGAWGRGAHGKRLDGWQGRRVVMGCADCHDPHKPAVEPQIPFRAPRIERTRSHDK
jgi:hypothetical protein